MADDIRQNLTDLASRTATADTDLIHVNSGGSDYKQTKANFLQGNLSLEFSFSSLLTSQVDALPVDATYFGYLWNYGHTTETGVPINGLSYVHVKKTPSSQYSVIEVWSALSPEGDHYICAKSIGTWGSWTKVPTRSEITALNNSLTKYYDTGAYPDITIGSNHEASFDKPSEVVGKKIVAINILSWSSATGAFFIAGMYDAQSKFFVGGDAGVVIKGLILRVWYKD